MTSRYRERGKWVDGVDGSAKDDHLSSVLRLGNELGVEAYYDVRFVRCGATSCKRVRLVIAGTVVWQRYEDLAGDGRRLCEDHLRGLISALQGVLGEGKGS